MGIVVKPSVSLISYDNGIGLSTDLSLMTSLLSDEFDVRSVFWREPVMPPVDVGIFLELWSPQLQRYARRTVGIFNLEWFMPSWRAYLPTLHQLWAKSAEAHAWYQSWQVRTSTLTGFLGKDLHDPRVPRRVACLHLRGHSSLKGTDTVLEAWRRDPDLPPLTIVSAVPLLAPPNVKVLPYLPADELARLMNACLIHVCPSQSEGWGHYIAEALSVGAIVVTTDASPMNEHVRPGWGYLIPSTPGATHNLAPLHEVDPEDLAVAVAMAAALPPDRRRKMGQAARDHFLTRNRRFAETALPLLRSLL
jgi:hypothetical protein